MKIGLGLPQGGAFATPDAARRVAVAAEAAGYASLWACDRLLAPISPLDPCPLTADRRLPPEQRTALDPVVTLATAAAVTDRIAIGTSVLVAPWYPPALLARTAASLDVLSGGRFTLGLGLGWSRDEYAAVGVPMRRRQLRIEEMLEVMARIWHDVVVEIETTHETIVPSTIALKPFTHRVPILLAASTPGGLERIARRANGWTPTGLPADAVREMWATVLRTAECYGRDTTALRLVPRVDVAIVDGPIVGGRLEFTGSLPQVRGDVERMCDIGADELIVDLQRSARSVEHLLELADELATGAALTT